MNLNFDRETIENIIIDEGGVMREPYFCTKGKLTWLAGRNIEDRPLTKDEISILKAHGFIEGGRIIFNNDLTTIYEPAVKKYLADYIEKEVRIIVLNMMYNMGQTRFNQNRWPKFFRAINYKNYKEAAKELKYKADGVTENSYFRTTKTRAKRLYNSLIRISNTE